MFLIFAGKRDYTHIKPKDFLVKGIEHKDGAVYSTTKMLKN